MHTELARIANDERRRPPTRPATLKLPMIGFLLCVVAFPKAGLKIGQGGYPVNASSIATVCAVLALPRCWRQFRRCAPKVAVKWMAALGLYSLWLIAYSAVEWGVGPTLYRAVPVILPIGTVPWLIANSKSGSRLADWFIGFAWIPLLYGIAQLVFGASRTIVPGLTVNYTDWKELGDQIYARKHGATAVGVKLGSTYQNGNLYGILLICIFTIILTRLLRKTHRRRDLVMLVLTVVSLIATFSRTALICSTASMLFILVIHRRKIIQYLFALSMIFLLISQLWLSKRLLNFDTKGAGRVPLLTGYFSDIQHEGLWTTIRLATVGLGLGYDGAIRQTESAPLNLALLGGVTLSLLYLGTLVAPLFGRPRLRYRTTSSLGAAAAVFGLLLVFALDQSLYLPPSASLLWLMYSIVVLDNKRRLTANGAVGTLLPSKRSIAVGDVNVGSTRSRSVHTADAGD